MTNSGRRETGEEATIKVASKKEGKEKPKGNIKLKKPKPKTSTSKVGVWRESISADGKDGLPTRFWRTPEC